MGKSFWEPKVILVDPGHIESDFSAEIIAVVMTHDSGKYVSITDPHGKIYEGKTSSPHEIADKDFDYIIFFSMKDVIKTRELFKSKGISDGKIVTYEYYMTHLRGKIFYSYPDAHFLADIFEHVGAKSVLDADMFFAVGQDYAKSLFHPEFKSMRISAFNSGNFQIYPAYKNFYCEELYDFPRLRHFDVILFARFRKADDCLSLLGETYDMSDMTIFYIRKNSEAWDILHSADLSFMGEIDWLDAADGSFLCVQKKKNKDAKFFVVIHKKYPLPDLPPCYQPIHAGKKGKIPLGFSGDDTGDEISEMNHILNEMTAMYWVWKNSKSAFVGISHYHRYFVKSGSEQIEFITDDDARELMRDCDIVVAPELMTPGVNAEQIAYDIGEDAAKISLSIIREEMEKNVRDYLDALDYVAYGQGLYRCNMLITRRYVFDAYCSWLFSFIIGAAGKFDAIKKWKGKSARAVGFWGERMLTVWLLKNDLRIKEIPMAELPHTINYL